MASRRYGFVRPSWNVLFRLTDTVGDGLRAVLPGRPVVARPSRIALVNLAHIGDVLLTTPAIAAVRERFPHARLTLFVGPWGRDAVANLPGVEAVTLFRAPWWDRERGSPGLTARAVLELAQLQRDGRFDVAVNFKSFFQENLASALAGIPTRIGYGLYGGGFLHTREVPFPWGEHTVVEHLQLVQALGATTVPRRVEFHPSADDREWAATVLPGAGVRVAMHVGAGAPARRWPLDRFREVAQSLARERGVTIVLVGGAEDIPPSDTIGRDPGGSAVVLAGRGGLGRTAAALERCAAFVGNDSGPAHLAAAMGVPAVVVFSGTNEPARWRPWGDRVTILQERPECAPCGLAHCARDDHACMTRISTGRVLDAVCAWLDADASERPQFDAPQPRN